MVQFADEEKNNKVIDDLKKQEEEELMSILAKARYKITYVDLSKIIVDNEALRFVTEEEARRIEVAPFKITGKNLDIAVRSPEKPEIQELKIRIEKLGYHVTLYLSSRFSLEKVWERYRELSFAEKTRKGGIEISSETIAEVMGKINSIKDVEKIIVDTTRESKTHKISKIFEVILAGAIAIDASDIHIEPEEESTRIRFRLDGVLQDIMSLPAETFHLLNSRIKLLSGLKLTMNNIAQDGRFSIDVKDVEINVRTSTAPGSYGESIVMRLLNPKSIQVKLEDMGIEPKLFEIMDKEITKPNGLILVTGPTGSGKTTTLYAFLRRIYSKEIKIITIEDPVEYHLEGITQTQVEKNYTFIQGLRAALRQDPDVIMVGEIRDDETAKVAVESALTGHIVFSTLHTNNAAGAIPRLIDLEVSPKIIPSALSMAIAQRLIRKLCLNCRKEKIVSDHEKEQIKYVLDGALKEGKDLTSYGIDPNQEYKLYSAVGCEKCNFTGFKGRIGIFEAVLSDANIEKIIVGTPSERDIKKIAMTQGILDMKEDGIIKVLKGITSLEEVKSVVDITEEI